MRHGIAGAAMIQSYAEINLRNSHSIIDFFQRSPSQAFGRKEVRFLNDLRAQLRLCPSEKRHADRVFLQPLKPCLTLVFTQKNLWLL